MQELRKVSVSLCAALLAACSTQPSQVSAPKSVIRPAGPTAPKPIRPAPSAADFVARAGAIDLFEIQSAQLALERSDRRAVRDFAAMEIDGHKGTSSQLALAGRRLNLLPSRALTAEYAAKLDNLRTAPDFDAAYKRAQLTAHQQALGLLQTYAARGKSPTLRPVAAAGIPVIERHLRMLRYL